MCGIAGLFDPTSLTQDPHSIVGSMCETMVHRGPDAHGITQWGPLTFGHRRLSIIDVQDSANQPMETEDQNFLITFNGEIYNFQSIRSELEAKGIHFKTHSDTEVVLKAWRVWGPACLEKLVGMYAFALWDKQREDLYLVRDRFGEKPLYYAFLEANTPEKGLIFGSTLESLFKCPRLQKTLNPEALGHYLSLNYTLTSQCIYRHVHKLPPAHFLKMHQGQGPELTCYWDLAPFYQDKFEGRSEETLCEDFNTLLHTTLKGQMISDVPLGAFLSGGIDSSTLVAGMGRLAPSPDAVKTFSIDFPEKSYSEAKESTLVARHLGVDHTLNTVSSDLFRSLTDIIPKLDEPFADSSLIPTYHLSKHTRDHVTVALSGDGGDELFLGYETYLADKIHHSLSVFPRFFFKGAHQIAKAVLPSRFDKVSLDYKIKQFLYGSSHSFRQAHYAWREILKPPQVHSLLKPDLHPKSTAFMDFDGYFEDVRACHPLDQAAYVDIKTWMVDDILVKVDRASMAHSLEVRAPFLDHRIAEFAARLPVSLKLKGLEKKYLLKKSQEPYLPHNILYRKKKGFNAPVSHWIQENKHNFAKEALFSNALLDLMDETAINKLWSQHQNQRADHGLPLFGLITLSLWLQGQ